MDLEDLLVREGVAVPADELRRVLDGAEQSGRNAVVALVEEGVIGEDVLAEVLARGCGTVVVDFRRPRDPEAAARVTKTMALEHLALPISASTGGKLRVAFANPLDERARQEIEEVVGAKVQPLVGILSGLRKAIDEAYRGRTTQVVKAENVAKRKRRSKSGRPTSKSELAPEITQQIEVPTTDTAQLHRLEEEATIEQRHEALLLALIEAGIVTRTDYTAALKRLLSGRRDH